MGNFNVITINRHRMNIDGKGVTSLVALEGCPLRCKYCINMDVLFTGKAKAFSCEELWEKLSIDYCYFIGTGGGVTFGGGESLMYAQSIIDFAGLLPEGVAVNAETSFNISFEDRDEIFNKLTNIISEFIIDVKTLDSSKYEQYTGCTNEFVMLNLQKLADKGVSDKCLIKIPVIPGFTSRKDAEKDAQTIRKMGFSNVNIFDYVIRDYMNNM